MPQITTIKEYNRNHKSFPVGTKINVTWEKAYELEKEGICSISPKVQVEEKKIVEVKPKKEKKVKKDGSNK